MVIVPDIMERQGATAPPLSAYLEDLVRRGWISRPIAKAINGLPTEALQSKAVQQYLAQQSAETPEIKPSFKMPIGWISNTLYVGLAGLCLVFSIKEIWHFRSATPSSIRTLSPPVILIVYPPSAMNPLRADSVLIPQQPARTISVPRAALSNVPGNFTAQLYSHGIRFSWTSIGAGFTYTIYSGDGPALRVLHKEKEGISGDTFTLSIRKNQKASSWWAISATNAYGGEGPLSGAVTFSAAHSR